MEPLPLSLLPHLPHSRSLSPDLEDALSSVSAGTTPTLSRRSSFDSRALQEDLPPPYSPAPGSRSGSIASGSTGNLSGNEQHALVSRFVTRTGGIFTVEPKDLAKTKLLICPYSDEESPHIMEGKGPITDEVYKRAIALAENKKNYIAQHPDGNGAGDLQCLMEKGYTEADLPADARLNRDAGSIQVNCQGVTENGLCKAEMPLSIFPEHWHNECPRIRNRDTSMLYEIQATVQQVKSFVQQNHIDHERKIQSLETALRKTDAKAELGINMGQVGQDKADWLKDQALGNAFDDVKTTVTSKFNYIESNLVELEGKLEKLIQENESKNQLLNTLQESVKNLEAKSMAQADALRALQTKTTSYNGQLTWKIENFSQKRQKAINGEQTTIYSEPFYTSTDGYKLGLVAYLNGNGQWKDTHLSLFIIVYKGNHDAILPWPFNHQITFELISQVQGKPNLTDSFIPSKDCDSYKCPADDSTNNTPAGCPMFVGFDVIEKQDTYKQNDVVFLGVKVEAQSSHASVSQHAPQAAHKATKSAAQKKGGYSQNK